MRRGLSAALLVLALGPAVGQGLGRFGYGVILPEMRAGLDWSYAQAGFVNTANALGYLLGALVAARVLARVDLRTAFLAGMAVIALALLATAPVRDFAVLSGLRVIAGAAAAVVFVAGGTLLAGGGAAVAGRRGFHLAAYYAGVGFGLLLVGLVLPPLLAVADWQWGWVALGLLSLPLVAVAAVGTRSLRGDAGAPGAGRAPVDWGASGWLLLGYLLYGVGGIGYMTFISAVLAEGAGWGAVTLFWSIFALGAGLSPFVWEHVLERWGSARAFLAISGVNALGALMPLLPGGVWAVHASAFVFGLSFFTVVAVTTLHVARVATPEARAASIAAFTVMFAAGQAVGPVLTGAAADLFGSLDAGLLLGAAILALGAAVGALQRDGRGGAR